METKKKTTTTTKKSATAKKAKTTKIPATKKTTRKKPKKKAFTLIELLAVIIILGVLMIIAVPSVTSYISNSRKSAYVTTAKNLMDGARTKVNEGKISVYDTDTTYYIPAAMIKTETGGAKSPYGDFEKAYVVVTYNGDNFDYYWVSVDTTKTGVRFEKYDQLDESDIKSNLELDPIPITGVDGRSKIVEFDINGIPQKRNASKQFNSTNSQIVDNPVTQVCIVREPYSKANAEYYTYTGNPTIQDIIDMNLFTIDEGKSIYDFRTNAFFECTANNPYDNNSDQYYDYRYRCGNNGNLDMVFWDYDEKVKDSTQGCYLIEYPIM